MGCAGAGAAGQRRGSRRLMGGGRRRLLDGLEVAEEARGRQGLLVNEKELGQLDVELVRGQEQDLEGVEVFGSGVLAALLRRPGGAGRQRQRGAGRRCAG